MCGLVIRGLTICYFNHLFYTNVNIKRKCCCKKQKCLIAKRLSYKNNYVVFYRITFSEVIKS